MSTNINATNTSQFARRKQSKKRRPRSSFQSTNLQNDSTSSSTLQPPPSRPPVPTNHSTKKPLSLPPLSIRPSSSSAVSRLRAPPSVPGYDPQPFSPPSQPAHPTYSPDQLNSLRAHTASTPQQQEQQKTFPPRLPDDLPPNKPSLQHHISSTPTTANTSAPTQEKQSFGTTIPNVRSSNTPLHVPLSSSSPSSSFIPAFQSRDCRKTPMLSRLADPFSEEWGRGINEQPAFLRYSADDDAIQPVTRLKSVNTEQRAASASEATLGNDGIAIYPDENDNEWHDQLLKRAGVNMSEAVRKTDDESFRRDERIMREELATIERHDIPYHTKPDINKNNNGSNINKTVNKRNDSGTIKPQNDDDDGGGGGGGENSVILNTDDIDVAVKALQSLLDELDNECQESERVEMAKIEDCKKLQRSAKEADTRIDAIMNDMSNNVNVQLFYESFAQDLDTLAMALRKQKQQMMHICEERIGNLRKRAIEIEQQLREGVDEFGRVRCTCRPCGNSSSNAAININDQDVSAARLSENVHVVIDANDDEIQTQQQQSKHPLSHLDETLQCAKRITQRFSEWCDRFPKEYEESSGDIGCGRMVGAIATCEPTLTWVFDLNNAQCREACNVWDVVEEACWTIRAHWNPSDVQSCQRFGRLTRILQECNDEQTATRLDKAIGIRIHLEIGTAKRENDHQYMATLLIGMLHLFRATKRVVHLIEILEAVVDKDTSQIFPLCRSGREEGIVLDTLRWIVDMRGEVCQGVDDTLGDKIIEMAKEIIKINEL